MPPLSQRIAFVGLSKQAVKGTPVTPPTYGLGLLSGRVAMVDLDQDLDEMTSTERWNPQALRLGIQNGADFETRVWPASAGLLFYAALGAIATTGTNPYVHTITPAATLPYLTAFGRLDSLYTRIADCKIDELVLSWDKREPPKLAVKVLGTTLLVGTSWSATNDETTDAFLPTAGGTFKLDTGSATAVDAQIAGGQITIRNNLSPIELSKTIEPDDIWQAVLEVEYSLKLIPNNLDEWRKIVTGTAAGTAVQTQPEYGAADVKFTEDADNYLQIASPRVAFLADFPDASPSGDPVELTVVGKMADPTGGGAPITATVGNTTASY